MSSATSASALEDVKQQFPGVIKVEHESPPSFIALELDSSLAVSECVIEMEDTTGAKMRMCLRGNTDPNSGLGKAITYMIKHWNELTQFLRVPGALQKNSAAIKKSQFRAISKSPVIAWPLMAPINGFVQFEKISSRSFPSPLGSKRLSVARAERSRPEQNDFLLFHRMAIVLTWPSTITFRACISPEEKK